MASSPPVPVKETLLDPYSSVSHSYFAPISPLFNAYDRFALWRADLGLPSPGTVENLQKKRNVTTHLSNFIFDGARADLTKSLSMSPLFQVTHSFALGSQTAPSSYNFGAIFGSTKVFLQGGVDHDGNVSGRFNYGWTPSTVTKLQAQLSQQAGHNMIQLEHDFQGADFSRLPTATPDASEVSSSYLAKITGTDKNWIATAQTQGLGVLQATYWQKLSEKVEVAADLQLIAMPNRREAITTIGAKYDLRLATFRAQVDSTGKVSALLEQRFTPTFAFLIAGEIDHFKAGAKVGVEEMGMPPQS
ncbi:eukaryotic porin-domain-containing protein [Mycena olivaceomarginata]|nr:eukaryotic porin-domain-containing protein [Mycena olivaceomarginata]